MSTTTEMPAHLERQRDYAAIFLNVGDRWRGYAPVDAAVVGDRVLFGDGVEMWPVADAWKITDGNGGVWAFRKAADHAPAQKVAAEQLLAASRDASCWPRPNTRSSKVVHVAVNVVPGSAHAGQDLGDWGEAACAPDRMPLDMSVAGPAVDVPVPARCRRPGCASRWPASAATDAAKETSR